MCSDITSFPYEVSEKLAHYVYRLIDPRNGETFYVGRGHGDRVFSHVKMSGNAEEKENLKLDLIAAIRAEGLSPIHIIHRHGMTEEVAAEVEAALIDAYPWSTNLKSGDYSGDFGALTVGQIIIRYSAEPFRMDHGHKLLLIKIGRSIGVEADIYSSVRAAWRIDVNNARKADLVLALSKGLVVGVFKADIWKQATLEDFPTMVGNFDKRWGFDGHPAPTEVEQLYLGKVVPDELKSGKGAANPIRYSW